MSEERPVTATLIQELVRTLEKLKAQWVKVDRQMFRFTKHTNQRSSGLSTVWVACLASFSKC